VRNKTNNKYFQLTVKSVTFVATEKSAPLFTSTEARRYILGELGEN